MTLDDIRKWAEPQTVETILDAAKELELKAQWLRHLAETKERVERKKREQAEARKSSKWILRPGRN